RLQRSLRRLRAHDPPHHGRGARQRAEFVNGCPRSGSLGVITSARATPGSGPAAGLSATYSHRPIHNRAGAGCPARQATSGGPMCVTNRQKVTTMNTTTTQILVGVSVPQTPLVEGALDYARHACEPYLYNHVVRSWLFAERIGQLQ